MEKNKAESKTMTPNFYASEKITVNVWGKKSSIHVYMHRYICSYVCIQFYIKSFILYSLF